MKETILWILWDDNYSSAGYVYFLFLPSLNTRTCICLVPEKKRRHALHKLTSYNKNIESTSASNIICTEFAYHIFFQSQGPIFLNSMNLYEIVKMVKNYLTPSLNFSRRKEVVLNLKNWYEFKRNNFVHIILCTFF